MPTDTFSLPANSDEAYSLRTTSISWANIASGTFNQGNGAVGTISKSFFGTDYYLHNFYLRFDTSSLPDDAIITSAVLNLYVTNRDDTGNVDYAADFYDFGGLPADSGDWEQYSSGDAIATIDATTALVGGANAIPLTGLAGISKTGYTGLRLALKSTETAAPTADNYVEIATDQDATPSHRPTLQVTYFVPSWTKEQAKASTSNVIAFDSDVKSGSLLIIGCDGDDSNPPPNTPTDSRGNIWTLIHYVGTVNSQDVSWWWAISKDAGACTVTFEGLSNFDGYLIAEYSTTAGVPTLDVEDTRYDSAHLTGTDAIGSATVTASQDDSLGLSLLGTDSGGLGGDVAAGTGCTIDTQSVLNSAGGDRVALEHKFVGAGSVNMPWSVPSGSNSAQVHIAVFKVVTTSEPPPAGDAGPTLIRLIGNRQTW